VDRSILKAAALLKISTQAVVEKFQEDKRLILFYTVAYQLNYMKKWFFILFAMIIGSGLMAQQTVINDPNAQGRNAKDFHAIEVSSAINLYLSQGNEEAVAVSAKDAKYRDLIRTEVRNGVLKIWLEKDGWRWSGGDKRLKAYVSFKTIDRLNASGASDILVDGSISGEKLDIRLSGASDFKGAIKLVDLNLDQSGASDVTINGTVNVLSIDASGASNVKGYDLVTEECTIRASGASDVKISVNKELNANASGASSISYKGGGVIREFKSSGASSISKKS
jgi:Putative auto-transporter adhesin, head GIN domain